MEGLGYAAGVKAANSGSDHVRDSHTYLLLV